MNLKESENCARGGSEDLHSELRSAVKRWKKLREKNRHSFYFENIRPVITGILGEQIEKRISSGGMARYDTLVVVAGHDVTPALIVINSLKPETLFILYNPRNKSLLDDRLLPNIDYSLPRDRIVPVELNYLDHESNRARIGETLDSIQPGSAVLCDITGGKKIISASLAVAASGRGIDISYIDSDRYIPGKAVPEPGTESLYIQPPVEAITRIPVSEDTRLIINYIPETCGILYHLDFPEDSFRSNVSELSDTTIENFKKELSAIEKKIDHNITMSKPCGPEMDSCARIITNMLNLKSLAGRLSNIGDGTLSLRLDPETAAIPWEIALNRRYKMRLPLFRMFIKEFEPDNLHEDAPEQGDILVIFGSGDGLTDFDKYCAGIREFFETGSLRAETVNADSKGAVQKALSMNSCGALIYFGHSEFSSEAAATGWVCRNGEIFSCLSIEELSGSIPRLIISNSCVSARSEPFSSHSFAYHAMKAGARTFIGTRWKLEYSRSRLFLELFLREFFREGRSPGSSFASAISGLAEKFGEDDHSVYNYIYYGI